MRLLNLRVASGLLLAAAASGCASRAEPAAPAAPVIAAAPAAADLPAGRGRDVLFASCTSCHDLREVTKFAGFYDRAQWRDIVVTMVEYGAVVNGKDVEVLADYLAEHLGRRATSTSP